MESKPQAGRSLEAIERAIERAGTQRKADLHELLEAIEKAHQSQRAGVDDSIAGLGQRAAVAEADRGTLREQLHPVESAPAPAADRPEAPESAHGHDATAPSPDLWRRLRQTLHGRGPERA